MTFQGRVIAGAVMAWLAAAMVLAQAAAPAGEKGDALSEAARKGDAAAVTKLLDEGVDVNTKFRYDRTALSFAADRGHLEVVKVLLDRGADVNIADTFYKLTALSWAVSPAMERKPSHAEVVRLLLEHGARGKDDALLEAVSAPDAATVKVILDVGGLSADALADAHQSAAIGKHPEIVAMLERAGAKPRVELKLDPSQLARYTGAYQSTQMPPPFVVTVADGRLVATLGGQKLTLVARDETTFGVAERPGTTVTARIEQDRATTLTLNSGGSSITFTRTDTKEKR